MKQAESFPGRISDLKGEGRWSIDEILTQLFALQDPIYREFSSKLMPALPKERVIGIRVPQLRQLARRLAGQPVAMAFLQTLPHDYYEEYNLHGMLLEQIKDYDQCVAELDRFLPYVDNWATCDLISPKVLGRHKPKLLTDIRRWMESERPFTVRFGIEMLMRYFLNEDFQPVYLDWAAKIRSSEYYVNMMTAWFFATALAKQYEAAVPYLEQSRLDSWTHNKAIQKAIESNRIPAEHKAYLRTLKQTSKT